MSVRCKTSIAHRMMETHTEALAAIAKLKEMRDSDSHVFNKELRKTWRTWCCNYNANEFQQWLAENNVDVRLIARRRGRGMHHGLIFQTPSGKKCAYWVQFVTVSKKEHKILCLCHWPSLKEHRAALECAGYVA